MKIKGDVWEAERLLERRRRNGHCEYLVKWRNYSVRESTWEPEENILDTGLLAHFNYSLKMQNLPASRGRPRKRPSSNARAPPSAPPKRQRRSTGLKPAEASSSKTVRGRPSLRPAPQPVRERNQVEEEEEEEEMDESEEEKWLASSEESEEDVEDDVEDDEDDEERENVGRRRRSSRVSRAMPPLRRKPLMVTPGQGALSGVKRQELLLTDVTWDGITVTIKEDMALKSKSPLH